MKTNNTVINSIITKATKYICAVVMLLGMSVSAWGTTLHYGAGGSSTMSYTAPTALPGFDDVGSWESTNTWITYEITSASSYDYTYGTYFGKDATNYDGKTDLYALYQNGYDFITRPTACSSQGVIVTDGSYEEEGEGNYGTLTSFSLSVASDGTGAVTWSTSDANVATVSGNRSGATVTVVGAGLVDITASVAADATHCAGEGTYTLLVNPIAPTLSDNTSGKELTVSSITSTGATFSGGVVTNKGGADITKYGFTVGTSSTVVIGGTGANAPVASGFWNDDITLNTAFGSKTAVSNFSPNTTYYVRAFAYNGSVYGYSTAVEFTTLQRYAVTYYKNDGGATSEVEYKDHGVNYTVSSDKFSRDHYTLSKWHTLAAGTGGTDYAKGATYSTNAALDLYAIWTPDNQTISFNANGGSGEMESVERAYNSTYELPACTFTAPAGKVFKCWAEGSAGGTERAVGYTHTVNADITFYAKWRDAVISDYVFSCAELTLTPHLVTDGTPIFITSTASKKVRSQDYIQITGSGLTPNSDLSFPNLNSKFAVLTASGGTLSTDEYGSIDEAAYIFYTPAADATTDGLDQMAGLTVSVGGAKPKQASLVQSIIGRHLPAAGYVIAGKKDNKWYALPSNMASTGTPAPSEIAVDNINNPSIAYTAATNIYGLEGPVASNISGGNGQYVRLTMSIESSEGSGKPAPLFGTSGSEDASNSPKVGKSGTAIATNPLSEGWWWSLTQTNTSITNPQDAKYTIKCANNNHTLSIKNSPFVWGLYASGVEELRLIPASNIPFTEAYFVEWAQHGGVVEVDAEGIDATSVTAHLGANSATATLSQTLTSGKGRASIYNYTVNFEGSIDFAAAASNGALLTLEWKNGETVKAMTSLVVPKIIASTSTLSSHGENDGDWSSAEVHVLPGVTLTANAGDFTSNDVMIRHLEIYPGATVVVTKGSQASGTLKVKTLVLRNGWTRAGEKAYDVARLYITPTTASLAKNAPSEDVWYTDWYIDYDQYYPIAVPWDVTLANITYRYCSVEPTVGHDKNIRLRYYDGSSRAGGGAIGTNWKLYGAAGAESVPTKLEPSKGYALTAKRPSGKAFSILRMPLTIPSADWTAGGEKGEVSSVHKNQVSVTGWGSGTAQWYAMGWNFIGNPYMCTFNGNDDGIGGKLVDQQGKGVRYATIPDVDFKNYDQVAIADANLKPASGFFIQAENPEATYVTFASRNIVPPSAPTRFKTTTEAIPEQEAYIRLSYEGGKDQMGLIIGEDYTENYEVNADLAKVLGDAGFVKTYMQYGGMDMAYVAINEDLAREWIPVTVRIPEAGEYTYSLTGTSEIENLEGVYLIDYSNNVVTNLIEDNYSFVIESGTISGRFAINAIYGKRETPTDIDIINAGGDINSKKPVKFIWDDKVFILHNGVIYDSTGKRVREINR